MAAGKQIFHLFLDAELGDGAGLGRALGAEDLAAAAAVMLTGHHPKLEKELNYFIEIIRKILFQSNIPINKAPKQTAFLSFRTL